MIKDFRLISKKGEGTFSEVLKCQNVKNKDYFACKKMKQHYESWDQVNNLREIQAMRRLNPHENILLLHEVVFDKKSGTLCLILELMDMNLYELIKGRKNYLPEYDVKRYMWQLIQGLFHIHKNGIFHRDVKPENILIRDQSLKIADFGSCKTIFSRYPYTEYISTRWYRAPECLLTDGYYSYQMDLWSVGCVMFEILSLRPLFPGANEVDQIGKIHDILGTPDASILKNFKKSRSVSFNFPIRKGSGIERLLPHVSLEAVSIIKQLIEYDPSRRLIAQNALNHPYFRELRSNSGSTDTQSMDILSKKGKPLNLISSKENKENSQSEFNTENSLMLPDRISSRSNHSKNSFSIISPSLVKSDNQNKLKEIPINSTRKSEINSNQVFFGNFNGVRKKSRRVIVENSNSKPWAPSNSQSFLPKIYQSNLSQDNHPNSLFNNPFYSNELSNLSKNKSTTKYSKYYSNDKVLHKKTFKSDSDCSTLSFREKEENSSFTDIEEDPSTSLTLEEKNRKSITEKEKIRKKITKT